MNDYQNLENLLELESLSISELDSYLKNFTNGIVVGKVEQDHGTITNPELKKTALTLFNAVSDCINNYNDLKQKLADSQDKVGIKLSLDYI